MTTPDYFSLCVTGYSKDIPCCLSGLVTTDIGVHDVSFDSYLEIEGGYVFVGEVSGFVRVIESPYEEDARVVAVSFKKETVESHELPTRNDPSIEEYPWSCVFEHSDCFLDFLQIHDRPNVAPTFLPLPWMA